MICSKWPTSWSTCRSTFSAGEFLIAASAKGPSEGRKGVSEVGGKTRGQLIFWSRAFLHSSLAECPAHPLIILCQYNLCSIRHNPYWMSQKAPPSYEGIAHQQASKLGKCNALRSGSVIRVENSRGVGAMSTYSFYLLKPDGKLESAGITNSPMSARHWPTLNRSWTVPPSKYGKASGCCVACIPAVR